MLKSRCTVKASHLPRDSLSHTLASWLLMEYRPNGSEQTHSCQTEQTTTLINKSIHKCVFSMLKEILETILCNTRFNIKQM